MSKILETIWKHLVVSVGKPVKVDIRGPCEHHTIGPISRTFHIRREDLIKLLQTSNIDRIIDRIEITEYVDENRLVVYNQSKIEKPFVSEIKIRSIKEIEWDLEPQYGEGSAAEIKKK